MYLTFRVVSNEASKIFMIVPLSNSIATIWFIFEFIYYRFVIFARLDLPANTPEAETRKRRRRRRMGLSTLVADAFHPLKINIESTSLCLFLLKIVCSEFMLKNKH